MTEQELTWARVIWEYHFAPSEPVPSDAIVALGTNDLRVAELAASLWHRGFAPLLVMTGGIAHQGDLLETPWNRSEAEMFADVAAAHGVPRVRILLETKARNTAENLRFTKRLVAERGLALRSVVYAVKPFMRRRVLGAHAIEWPELGMTMASTPRSLDEYFTPELTPEKTVNIMMGDLERVWVYAERGWAAPQHIPVEVRDAFDQLKRAGYTRHLL